VTTTTVPDAPALETMPFGTDESVTRVLAAMIDHENTDPGAVLYGCTNWTGAITAYYALRDAEREDVGNRAFRFPGTYFLDAEWSAVLFEALTDYAQAESVCDVRPGNHCGYAGDVCDCMRREHAWSWVASIAEIAAGIELV
jgi:hypothetical protein